MCPLCREADRADQHFLSACKHLPDQDHRYLTKARLIGRITDDLKDEVQVLNTTVEEDMDDQPQIIQSHALHIQVSSHSTVRRVLRAPTERSTIWPGEYVEVTLPNDLSSLDGSFALLILPA